MSSCTKKPAVLVQPKVSSYLFSKVVSVTFVAALLIVHSTVHAASLSLIPSNPSGSYTVGQIFTVPVFVSTRNAEAMNAVSAVVSFPQSTLELISIDKNGTIVDFWIGDSGYSNADGKATFEGGVYNPGYTGANGKIVSLVFRAKSVGTATISFSSASVLANDGQGSNILETTGTASVIIRAAVDAPSTTNTTSTTLPELSISSPTHPDQNKWYSSTSATLVWKLLPGTTAVRTLVDRNPDSIPSVLSTPPITETDVTLPDGVSYFHLQGRDATGWGRVSHFKIQIDTQVITPPQIAPFAGALTEGDPVAVTGSAEAHRLVTIYMKGGGGQLLHQSTQSGSDGRFSFVWSGKLPSDAYTVYGIATNDHGIPSAPSVNLNLLIQESAITRVGWPLLNVLTLIFVGLALLMGIFMWIWFIIHRVNRFRKKIRGEVKEADKHIRARFAKLENAVIEHIRILRSEQSKRKLTPHEEKIIVDLGKFIEETEEEIEKEVDRIGK